MYRQFTLCVALQPYVSLSWFGECAVTHIHWRNIIHIMKKLGSSHDDIHPALSDYHNLMNQQSNHIFAHYGNMENYDQVHRTGHPHKFTPCDRCVSLHHLANCDAANAYELWIDSFPDVCVDTVKTALREEGKHAYTWATVPFISKTNLHVHQQWARIGCIGLLQMDDSKLFRWVHLLQF